MNECIARHPAALRSYVVPTGGHNKWHKTTNIKPVQEVQPRRILPHQRSNPVSTIRWMLEAASGLLSCQLGESNLCSHKHGEMREGGDARHGGEDEVKE